MKYIANDIFIKPGIHSPAWDSEDTEIAQIADFNHMVNGAHYTLAAVNGASTKNQIKFPSKTTLYSEDIVAENGMTVVYNFFTDGYSIYCDRAIYA